jgi:HD-like signal output (HDOD) protein
MKRMWQRVFAGRSRSACSPPTAATIARSRASDIAASVPAPTAASTERASRAPPVSLAEIEDRFHRFVLGLPAAADAAGAPTPLELATLKRLGTLAERFDVRSLPRLPIVLPQLLRELKNDNVGGGQLATLIGRDPVLVGEVMRVTGSVHYRTAQPIHSVQHAVVLLGQEGLRRVATQHVMKPILQASAGMHGHMAGPTLWEHAERCAHACNWLGRANGCEPFEAYLAGMVCRTGTGAIVRLLDQEAPPSLGSFSPAFLADCMRLGARLSLRAAEHWELPAGVVRALAEQAEPPPLASRSPLGKALLCAEVLAMAQMLGARQLLPDEPDCSEAWPDCFKAPVLLRCQQELHRQFNDRAKA